MCVCVQGRSHIVAWGGRGPCKKKKKKKFPLDYEEKINSPPPPNIRHPAPPTHFSPILPALNQKLGTPSNFFYKNYLFYFQAKKKKKLK